jgi:hypothetical protein
MWTHEQAVSLCVQIEAICPAFGCHVALTGGCLYKEGQRKDLDLIFYRIRQKPCIQVEALLAALKSLGFRSFEGGGWRYVGKIGGDTVDLLFPEDPLNGEYPSK